MELSTPILIKTGKHRDGSLTLMLISNPKFSDETSHEKGLFVETGNVDGDHLVR